MSKFDEVEKAFIVYCAICPLFLKDEEENMKLFKVSSASVLKTSKCVFILACDCLKF